MSANTQFSRYGLHIRPGDCDDKCSILSSNSYRIFPVGKLVDNKGTLSHDEGPKNNTN